MGEWISVKDRLPEFAGWYLVFYNGSAVHVAFFRGKKWAFDNHYHTITHWMPLPEPPNGDNMNEIDKAIKFLREQYERAERIDAIYNPLAWALYQTWRHVDEPPKEG